MPGAYTTAVKQARMTAVVTAIGGTGVLELGTSAMALVLVTIALNATAGVAAGAVLTYSGFPKSDTSADASGKALSARIRTATGGNDIVTGFTVGLSLTAAPVWAITTAYTAGQYRTNGANVYKCVTAGTSAGSGGPTGTGTAIADGTVVWDWYCVSGADVQMDSLEITATQTVTVNSFTQTHA